jgi:SAM-dependent methyltransferase
MKLEFEKVYHELEQNHFWFKARRNYIVQELEKFDRDIKILDIGCSSGILLADLLKNGLKKENLFGIDISEIAINRCKQLGLENTFVMDAQNITLEEKFDVIIASDCLEHLKDDEKALQNWNSLLVKEGIAYIFVPAFMLLWSEHDVVNMHFRRYTKRNLKEKILQNGFKIIRSGYWNFLLFFPLSITRISKRLLQNGKKEKIGDLTPNNFNRLLFLLLSFENKLLNYFNFPIGVSTFCVVKKN